MQQYSAGLGHHQPGSLPLMPQRRKADQHNETNMNPSSPSRKLTKHDRAVLQAVQTWKQGARALFTNALHRSHPSALELILRENAVGADGAYYCHARDRYLRAKSAVNAEKIAAGQRVPSNYPYFAGPFGVGEADSKDRLALGPFQIFTFEYDRADPAFFMEQISWALPVKEPSKSSFGQLHARLKGEFADFALLSVVWSGNKSFHIHIVFDVTIYVNRHGAPDTASRHAGHRAHWNVLRPIVEDILKPSPSAKPKEDGPDGNVGWQTAYRRTPDAMRKIEKPGHPLGLKIGTKVRQLVIWEQASLRKKSDLMSLFLSPTRYPAIKSHSPVSVAFRRSKLTSVQERYVESCLAAHFAAPDCPMKFSHLAYDGAVYRAMLRNGPVDRTPSSYIHEDYVTPRAVGTHTIDLSSIPPLSLPLGQMISIWCSQLEQTMDFDPEALEAAYARLNADLPRNLMIGDQVLIHAPEGIRKSSSIMRLIHLSTVRGRRGRPSMFACSSYENAQDKADEFNFPDRGNPRARRQDGFVGIYWPSATQLYRDTADLLGVPRLSHEDADKAGLSNFWALVERDQPRIIEEMRRWHHDVMQEISDQNAVLFTHYEVAFRWRDNSMTRQLFAPDFYGSDFDRTAAHAASQLNWLIVDEISYPMFFDLFSAREMAWLKGLRDCAPKIWSGQPSQRQREHYADHVKAAEGNVPVNFFAAQRALHAGLDTFQSIKVIDNHEYPPMEDADKLDRNGQPVPQPYECNGEIYHIRERDWWLDRGHPIASTVIMTTTEVIPALVARKVMEAAPDDADAPDGSGQIFAYYAPNFRLGRDIVDVFASGKIVADKIPQIIAEYQRQPGTHIVSNKLRGVENATSHFEARGANDLTDKDIVQVVTMFPPAQYKQLRAIGTWLDCDHAVRLAHIDQINQSCGRNRGPRNRGFGHKILFNLRLFRLLNKCPPAMAALRYGFRTTVDANQRSNAKKVTTGSS